MQQITYDKFSSGLDHRKSQFTAGADSLRTLQNAHVTTGKELAKRPCLLPTYTLESGSIGLKNALGVLNTFYGSMFGAVAHGDPRFFARFVPHPTLAGPLPKKVWFCDVFLGFIYAAIEYDNGDVRHHYLDEPGIWVTATVYAVGNIRRPTVANGYRYEVTALAGTGTSGGAEPTWPTTVGATVVDNAGANQLTWTCRSFAIVDTNCPNTKSVVKLASKIFAIGGDVVRYCATGAARNWTAASDAGFISSGINQTGNNTAQVLVEFKNNLAISFTDGLQVWAADPNPANIVLLQKSFNIGCRFIGGVGQVSQDTFLLTDSGFRSIALALAFQTLEDNDVGSPIDDIVKPFINDALRPFTVWLQSKSQLWSVLGQTVMVYTFSPTSKLAAWSTYLLPTAPDDITVQSSKLYIRVGNDVSIVDENARQDNMTPPTVRIEFPYLDCKVPGALKMFQGVDVIGKGTFSLSFKYLSTDANNNTVETQTAPYSVTGNTMPGFMNPVELCSVAIAPVIEHTANEAFELSRLTFYYTVLGAK